MSTNKLSHLKDGDKIYLEVTRDGGGRTGYESYYSSIVIGDKDTFYTLEELKQLANDGMPMTNREKLNFIYERMGGYSNPRKDEKKGWTIYDQNPVLIGNVLQFMKDLDWDCIPNRIYILWEHLILPIDEQSDECIDFVYALTKE